MHLNELRAGGETEQIIYLLAAWRESLVYSQRERTTLFMGEPITLSDKAGVSDAIYEEARKEFADAEPVDLNVAVIAVNG